MGFGKKKCLYTVLDDRAHWDKFKLFQNFKEIDNNVISELEFFAFIFNESSGHHTGPLIAAL